MVDANVLVALTADIVAAHVSNNSIAISDIAGLIGSVHASLSGLGQEAEPEPRPDQKPAVPIRASIKPEYLVCLEDGKQVTLLKSYLRTKFGMTPDDYRKKWNLPKDYPMVSPSYAERRRVLAKEIGLGTKGRADRLKQADTQ
ncbi:MucR family transcriptional regulator [Blastomonas fulva]|uniref:Transcriptional regulator n=1 Tax=Blastomonas fulva TaxID=1550728 RepID=A0ABN5B271_9SPHN|nr:MucR family transcriptional regulator [Blastomonas fulva]ASR50931.1 transcriptional regulator [Blastomonas fulva]